MIIAGLGWIAAPIAILGVRDKGQHCQDCGAKISD